ncbi:translation initiation factor IF-2 [Engraulis encrasicolus]|uniref:translation initiation factor IF-2 n=1 Tax=Engraulis encrasicolus TaxID=184585 RepID=UPI002FD581D8
MAAPAPALPNMAAPAPALPNMAPAPALPNMAAAAPALLNMAAPPPALPNMAAPAPALPNMAPPAPALPNMAAPPALPNMAAPISTFSVDSCMSDTYRLKYHKPRPGLPFMTDIQGEGQPAPGEGQPAPGECQQPSPGQLSSGEEPEEEVNQQGHTPLGTQRTNQPRAETGSRAAGRWNPVTFRGLDEHGYL